MVHFGHFGQKYTGWGFFILRRYILAILGEMVLAGGFYLSRYILAILGKNVPPGGFLFLGGTFWPFWAKIYRPGVLHSQLVHLGHFGRKRTSWGVFTLFRYILPILGNNIPPGGFSFLAGTFWPFWAKMYRLWGFNSQPVFFFRHFGRKRTGWGFFTLLRYILPILGKNVPPGGFSFLAGTFWPFWAKMYRLGVFHSQLVHFGHISRKCISWGFFTLSRYILAIFGKNAPAGGFYSQPVHFGHFGRKCTYWGFFILSRYILAISGKNVPPRGFFFSAGTFWPFWAKMYQLGVFLFSAGTFWPFWAKMYQLGVFILSRYILAILGENVPAWGCIFSAGTFWPFWAKMYQLGVFYSQPVYFGHFG